MGPTSDAPVECCRRCTKATVKCKIIVHVDGTQGTGGRSGPVLESQTRAEPNSNDGLHSGIYCGRDVDQWRLVVTVLRRVAAAELKLRTTAPST